VRIFFSLLIRYERFFEAETQDFLHEEKIDNDDFYRACCLVKNPFCLSEIKAESKSQEVETELELFEKAESKSQEVETGLKLFKDARRSARTVNTDLEAESLEQTGMKESQGNLMLKMALSSLNYKNFRDLMRDFRARRNEATAAAEEMGLF